MRKILILCGISIFVSQVCFAENLTGEKCANGSGVVVAGAIKGKYCINKGKAMNWWNAYAWCDAIGMKLIDIAEDCACSDTTADCDNLKCPNFSNVVDALLWTSTTPNAKGAYVVHGTGTNFWTDNRSRDNQPVAACK